MAKQLQSLSEIFEKKLFRIPDYQRGYAWEKDQLEDFWNDLMNLRPKGHHYTGLLCLKPLPHEMVEKEDKWLIDEKEYEPYHVIDGQQRMTTFVILLNEMVQYMRNKDKDKLGDDTIENIISKYICQKSLGPIVISTYLFGYEDRDPSADYMKYEIFKEPDPNTGQETSYTKNLKYAKDFFAKKIKTLDEKSGNDNLDALYTKLTKQLMFHLHVFNEDYNEFVTFETMNNRGKKLTNLELLKNRLIYLTTLYKNLDEVKKSFLRKTINDAWKEIYTWLGKNKDGSLSDDDFLRAHWIIYFTYSRRRGNDYIKYLLNKFSSNSILREEPVSVEPDAESVTDDDDPDIEDPRTNEEEELKTKEGSQLKPEDIKTYVNSLKNIVKYWYFSHYPQESGFEPEEIQQLDRLNRIGIGYFRPLVTVIMSRKDISSDSRCEIFKAIERYIFITFRLGNHNASHGSSKYYRAAHDIYEGKANVDTLKEEINKKTDADNDIKRFTARIEEFFIKGNGYYDWNSLKYFFYEYEDELAKINNIDRNRISDWSAFTKSKKDLISIEHILPQTLTETWHTKFHEYGDDKIKKFTGALGNLLLLSKKINSSLQNDSFEEKKNPTKKGRRGYSNGSHSEIEVSKNKDWTAKEIYDRSEKLLLFMGERWGLEFNKEQLNKLIGFSVSDESEATTAAAPEMTEITKDPGMNSKQ